MPEPHRLSDQNINWVDVYRTRAREAEAQMQDLGSLVKAILIEHGPITISEHAQQRVAIDRSRIQIRGVRDDQGRLTVEAITDG